jgi:hypothetical protein
MKHFTAVHCEATGTGTDEWAAISAVETAVEALASRGGNPAELQRAALTLTHAIGRHASAAALD